MPQLGPDPGQTASELDQRARITGADIAAARSAWRRDAPAWAKPLLDATPDIRPDPNA